MRARILASAALLLAGCDRVSLHQTWQNAAECRMAAKGALAAAADRNAYTDSSYVEACMKARGFVRIVIPPCDEYDNALPTVDACYINRSDQAENPLIQFPTPATK